MRFVWVDIEDESELVGDLDIEDFPTLLLARGGRVLFFGPRAAARADARSPRARRAATPTCRRCRPPRSRPTCAR
jgi:thioredoxin 1